MHVQKSELRTAVVALGGNSITREFEEGNITQQFANTRQSLVGVMALIRRGYRVVITHGNGPQVGNALIRVEETRHLVPPLPLGIIVADLQGGMGYMIQQTMMNKLHLAGIKRDVATILTQVVVDRNDPSVLDPTKFVGPILKKEDVARVTNERGWIVKEDPGRGYRRVVPSPEPLAIVEKNTILRLLEAQTILIVAGGGGIPVCKEADGCWEGVDAVIDKDLASAILARDVRADELYMLTGVDKVTLNFRKPDAVELDTLTVAEAKEHLENGQFPAGSMGPKIQAAINFLESGGSLVVISSIDNMQDAIAGKTGTRVSLN